MKAWNLWSAEIWEYGWESTKLQKCKSVKKMKTAPAPYLLTRWRHDTILKYLSEIIEAEIKKKSSAFKPMRKNHKLYPRWSKRMESFSRPDEETVFSNVIQTTLRHDIVLSSMISKAIVMIKHPLKPDVTNPTRERKQNTSNYKKIAKPKVGNAGCS